MLIPLLDEAEGGEIEQLRMNAGRFGVSQQDIDDIRVKFVTKSPIMAVIERCLDFLDDEATKEMVANFGNINENRSGITIEGGL